MFTAKVWRWAHLSLALVSALFLIIASLTGTVLAVDAAMEKSNPYRIEQTDQLPLVQFLPGLHSVFPELTALTVDHNAFVGLEGFDQEGNAFKTYIDPRTLAELGPQKEKSEFIEWVTALHRSLFLKETGRFIVGLVSILLVLITLSGIVLIAKRQNGWLRFFAKVTRDYPSQYVHVASGRWFLLPLLLLAVTGSYLFLLRFEWLPTPTAHDQAVKVTANLPELPLEEFAIFQQITLDQVQKIDFPFPDDPDEYYVLHLKDRRLQVHQFTGEVVQQTNYPVVQIYHDWSLLWHTGRVNAVVAILLGIASLSILLFIYSGFTITWKRTRKTAANSISAAQAEVIVLVGSENGTTKQFAAKVVGQLQALGVPVYTAALNDFAYYPNAKRIVVFTSTYGQGEAPYTAKNFGDLLKQFGLPPGCTYSVVGFGSRMYEDFCAYAQQVDRLLAAAGAAQEVAFHSVDEKSTQDFARWAQAWAACTGIAIATTPSSYTLKLPALSRFEVVKKQVFQSDESTVVHLQLRTNKRFKSGDLLAIYPAADARERLYSIGKVDGMLQLVVRIHPQGLGSGFLHGLTEGQKFQGRILPNAQFHLDTNASTCVLIANGTGIAPFLGMITEGTANPKIRLYAGFRRESELVMHYQNRANQAIVNGKLESAQWAYSRNSNPNYVMDLIIRDSDYFADIMRNFGLIYICGSLVMQRDVEAVLAQIAAQYQVDYEQFIAQGCLKTDCY